MNQHMSLELSVVQEALLAAFVSALEEFIAVHSHVLFERCPVVEGLATGGQVALEGLGQCAAKFAACLFARKWP